MPDVESARHELRESSYIGRINRCNVENKLSETHMGSKAQTS